MNVLNLKMYCLILILLAGFNVSAQTNNFDGDIIATGDITAKGGAYFIGDSDFKRISNFNLSAITYFSDHPNSGGFRMMTNEQDLLGALSGQNNAFGLKDKNGHWFLVNSTSAGNTVIKANNTTAMTLYNTGKVKIGDVNITPSGYKLFVEEGILAEKVRVALNGASDWADYVFQDDFELMPLGDVKDFIEKNDHLPNVPSAEQMIETGLDVLESDAILLRKIEEAYLYILQQQEQLDELKKEIANLKK